MICLLCEKRKGKRFCPAKDATICTICCGEQREVTIDCPRDCPYLIEAHRQIGRQAIDPERMPFANVQIPREFVRGNAALLDALCFVIASHAAKNPLVADPDVVAAVKDLAEAYQTLSRGIYYEQPPDHAVQRGVYEALKAGIEQYKKEMERENFSSVRDSEIRDALILVSQASALKSNGRPKSRAYIDFLRGQFKSNLQEPVAASSLIIP